MKIAIIASHPIQYYAPWFRHLSQQAGLEIQVYYLWDFGVSRQQDRKFLTEFAWDLPLLDGYEYKMMPNVSSQPGTHHFSGLNNPDLTDDVLQWKPDVVLFTTLFFKSPLKLLAALRYHSVPCFFRGDSHVLAGHSRIPTPVDFLKQLIFRQFTTCLYVGSANRDYFLKHGVNKKRLFAVPHCIDNERFEKLTTDQISWLEQQRTRLDLHPARTVLLFAGKFEQKKRPVLLAELFHSINRNDARLLFIGSGPLEKELKSIAGKDPRIHILPFQNQSIMPAVYRLADCLVLPSFGPSETWGLAVNESMASGVPALVSSHVGCALDLIDHGKTGWKFEATQSIEFRNQLRLIMDQSEDREPVAQAAKTHIASFSYTTATSGLLRALDTVE